MDRLANSSAAEFDFFGLSDIGKKRQTNQDQFLIAQLHKFIRVNQSSFQIENNLIGGQPMGTLMFVADGIGGGPAGDVASRMAIEEVSEFVLNSMHWLHAKDPFPSETFVTDLVAAINKTHREVRRYADNHAGRQGMGTTLTLAYIVWPNLYVIHVGDSRCYHQQHDKLLRITTDQTIAQSLCEQGVIKPDEVETSQYGNVLWSCIGAVDDPTAVIYQRKLEFGDVVMLCSDGVTRHLSDKQLGELLRSPMPCKEICRTVVDRCNEAGGADNISIVLTRCLRPASG